MAIETEEEVRAAVQRVAPGAQFTSAYRTPEHNEEVGGVPNSLHTRRGEGGGARALDIVPGTSGLSMAELNRRIANSGLNLQERLNEGDHVHVGFDGKPAGDRSRDLRPSVDSLSAEWLQEQGVDTARFTADTDYAQAVMGQLGYVARNGVWTQAPVQSEPLDLAYEERQAARESLALDQEEADILMAAQFETPGDAALRMGGAVAADVGKGLFLEGGQAVLSGIGRGINETMDAIDGVADWIENTIPGTLMWEGFDGDASTPMRISLTTQNEAERRMTEARGGDRPSFLQRLGMAQARVPADEEGRPESNTGRIVEGVSQFATGWVTGGRALRGWRAAKGTGTVAKALAQGAIADFTAFDGNEARLSNILADVAPDAIVPVFDYLSADEDDAELLGRAKNAVEGGLAGIAVDVLFRGIRGLRDARQARRQIRDEARAEGLQEDPTLPVDEAAARGEELQEAVRSAMGSPAGPRFRVNPDAEPVVTPFQSKIDDGVEATAGLRPDDLAQSGRNVFDINLARIETPDDVQAVIVGMADRFAKDADLARRATRSWEQTREAANGVDWVESMAARRTGDAVNAETALAYRQALNGSASKLLELARKVQAEPTLANQYAFRRATATHHAIQNELMGARAEAGRALNAFKIPAGAPATYLRQVDSLIADAGGANTAQELARKIIDAARRGDKELNEMVRGGAMARTREIVKLIYTNSLLSGVGTPIINAVGTPLAMLMEVTSRALSPRMARAFGGQGHTQIGEAGALLYGYKQAIRDMFRLDPLESARRIGDNAGERMRREGLFRGMAPGVDDAADRMGIALRAEREEAGRMAGSNPRPLSAGAWRVAEDTPLGRVLDVLQMIVEGPSNITGLTDDFYKVIAARGELHAQAFRKAMQEGLDGPAARGRIADLIDNPTDDMLVAAERQMHELTFTRSDGGFEKLMQRLRRMADENSGPVPLATYILPFLRTPANLTSLAIRSSPLAPFSARFRAALVEGGAAAETAKAQMALGTALWSVWMGMAMDGDITGGGPRNRAQREALQRQDEYGQPIWQPYSVRIGGRWYSYERLDPMGSNLSLIGDFAELLVNGDWDAANMEEATEIAANAVLSLGQAFFDKSMLQGAMEFTNAVSSNNASRAERFVMGRVTALVPGLARNFRRAQDPYVRETHNAVTAMMNSMPGLSDDLPISRDLWGKPRTYQTGLGSIYDGIVPIQTRPEGGSAIDYEILTHGVSVSMPARNINFMGESISLKNRPDIYSEFVRLAGEPAFEHLNAVAAGNHPDSVFYFDLTDGPDGGKAQYIREVVSAYRRDARAQVVDMFAADLQDMAAREIMKREEVRQAH